jgi:hypothetical protein
MRIRVMLMLWKIVPVLQLVKPLKVIEGDTFQKHLQETKVCQELTTPHTPEENGYLECVKCTVVEIEEK